jgi:hypothetical protein
MVSKTSILYNLKRLRSLYDKTTDPKNSLFYSKLAILELCGWIEESMDDLAIKCAKRELKVKGNISFIEGNIIDKTYGFEYKKHFRFMLMSLIGLIALEAIEKRIDQTKLQNFKSSLGNLRNYRDGEAHTHLKGVTRRLDAPSVTITNFQYVYEGLKCFEKELRKL